MNDHLQVHTEELLQKLFIKNLTLTVRDDSLSFADGS